MEMKTERQVGKHAIKLDAQLIGKDLLVLVFGGDEHHIGAIAMAYPTPSHYRDAITVSVNSLTFPGHKDYVVANSVAERICKALHRPVVATVGIHIDNATADQIKSVIEVVDVMTSEVIDHYQNIDA